jgi:alkaline phosphatase D
MGNIPLSGTYSSQGHPVNIRWATGRLDDTPQQKEPMYCVVQVNNAYNSPDAKGNPRWIAHRVPQVIVQFYNGASGELLYAEAVAAH